ncbi:MAG: helix-turn-helix domain-containing protein [Saprospiraceae bacterium]|nr:helix-turn-helix domain-containing protein [Saprospiraceae bacterium]
MSQAELAEKIGVSRPTVGEYENGKSDPPASVLKKLAELFQKSLDELIFEDIGAPLFPKDKKVAPALISNGVRVLAVTNQENGRENVEFVPYKAFAGYATSYSDPTFVSELYHFHLPKHEHGTYRAFEIKGDSMPPVDDGFIVVGKYVEDWRDLKSGKLYVFILKEQGIVFKRALREARPGRLMLHSDNPAYEPFPIDASEIGEAWEMVSYVAFPKDSTSYDNLIFDRLFAIEQKIEAITSAKPRKGN